MNFKKGVFTANTGTGNQAITGVGFQPKGLMIWTTYQTATGFSDTEGQLYQIGLTDGTRQNSMYARADDNTNPNDTDRANSQTVICTIRNLAGTNVRVGSLVSLNSDGFTINWTTADAVAALFHYCAWGGASLNSHVSSMGPGDLVPAAAIPFKPACVIFIHTVGAGDACNFPTFGFMSYNQDNTIGQGANYIVVEDNQATSDTWRYQRTNRATNIGSATTGAVFNDLSHTGAWLQYDTFTSGTGLAIHFIALGGDLASFGTNLLQPTGTGNQAKTGAGFQPKGLIVTSVGQTAQTTVQAECRFSLGAGDGTSQGWGWVGNTDNVSPSVCASGHSETNIVTMSTPNATGSSTSTEAQASLASLDADGFTLNWGTADATQREVLALAFGDSPLDSSEHSVVF